MGKRPAKRKRAEVSGLLLGAGQIFILPVGVFVLAVTLFAFLGFGIEDLVSEVKRNLGEEQPAVNPFTEIYAR